MDTKKAWFDDWFDTTYYHILYQQRNDAEAQLLMDNLANHLKFTSNDTILDLACGKGRHAIYLNNKGLQVVGVDLSANNITEAQQQANDRLQFFRHDMRSVFRPQGFDYVLNLFTSFGYFEDEAENQQAILATSANLKEGGSLILDFFNTHKVINELLPFQQKTMSNINFTIKKYLQNSFIIKEIEFEDNNQQFNFKEKVKAISLEEFKNYFEVASLELVALFGNYHLEPFDREKSDRMIFVVKK